ncbi:MAG: hypothetical protein AAF676_09500 [Pseudomonadota bacterium]
MNKRHGPTGPLLTLALAAALAGPCWAQQDAARGFSVSERPTAAPPARSPLEQHPCLDAPGCGRADAMPLMPHAAPGLNAPDDDPSPVPLPAALALLGGAMAAFALLRRRPADA